MQEVDSHKFHFVSVPKTSLKRQFCCWKPSLTHLLLPYLTSTLGLLFLLLVRLCHAYATAEQITFIGTSASSKSWDKPFIGLENENYVFEARVRALCEWTKTNFVHNSLLTIDIFVMASKELDDSLMESEEFCQENPDYDIAKASRIAHVKKL